MDKPKYHHTKIEAKWQKYWKEHNTFAAKRDTSKPKYYVLDMFPYPSGSGLHVGHVVGYTATDILARYKRQKGFNVLHPMGWDSFGLPAEQYAIRTGTHPAMTTQINIDNYRRQLEALGLSYDWNREFATSDPKFYKWTQWIFTKLYECGLAYEAEMLVNYCPALGTVLANEEVEDGKSKEGGFAIERRPLRQWVLKITAYAERLLKDLDLVDWPEGIKRLQQNWIGKSEGAKIRFNVQSLETDIEVFTTCPDTLFGATYIVLAPEHHFIPLITTPTQRAAVENYRRMTAAKSDLERTELSKEKTGVFTGAYAINPVTQRPMPIWIADYVLMGYGTGAIMAVPAHDERDFEFAVAYHLPITPVIHPEPIEENENVIQEVLKGGRCWSGGGKMINSAQQDFSLNGLDVPSARQRMIEWLESTGHGQRTVNYKLRDWLFSRQRYWGEPFPILHFEDGSKRVLDLDELPLCPPMVKDYRPTKEGLSPLASATEWVELIDTKTGKKAYRETNTMPQWAGSCWYYLRFCDPHNEHKAWGREKEQYWLPVDMYVGGAEHAVLHLLYSRFWHKVLYDCGLVHTVEPFTKLFNQGMVTYRSYKRKGGHYVTAEEVEERDGSYFMKETGEELISHIEKMSKSRLNVVTPDEMIEEFGADALRLYEMFMGPLDKEKTWNTDGVSGCRRFLTRFYDLALSEKVCEENFPEALKLGHRVVLHVEAAIEAMQFNVAIARMMEFVNDFSKLAVYPKPVLKMATQALAAFAPHLAEEIWELLGESSSIAYQPYPEVDAQYLYDDVITYVVQVNGKLRGRFDLPKDQDEATIVELAKQHPQISKHLSGKVLKVIFIPNKLLNFVVG